MMIGDVTTSLMQKIYSIRKKDRNIYIYPYQSLVNFTSAEMRCAEHILPPYPPAHAGRMDCVNSESLVSK